MNNNALFSNTDSTFLHYKTSTLKPHKGSTNVHGLTLVVHGLTLVVHSLNTLVVHSFTLVVYSLTLVVGYTVFALDKSRNITNGINDLPNSHMMVSDNFSAANSVE